MKRIRRLHLYLGCFFSPLLVFYVSTGWYQTFHTNRNKALGEQDGWIERLTSIHVDQIFPVESAEGYSPFLYQYLVATMSMAFFLTVVLGIYLAFRMSRRRWLILLILAMGILTPIILLWLGQVKE